MSIFGTAASTGGPSLNIYGFVVAVSKWTAAAPDDDNAIIPYPTYGAFAVEKRLKVLDCFVGSSIVGMSFARLELVLGEPTTSINVEDLGSVLSRGDRVLIGVRDAAYPATTYRWVWAGYCTRVQLTIGANEQCIYRCMGPEWLWGEGQTRGASRVFHGQLRRKGTADDTWAANPTGVTTTATNLIGFSAEPAVFNPGGRANMTTQNVELIAAAGPQPQVLGRVWENADRRISGTDYAAKWTVKQACKLAMALRNAAVSGIATPDFDSITDIADGDILRQTSIEGLGLWGALREICGAKYGFWIDPTPSSMAWAGFTIKFFSRAGNGAASLQLDPQGTNAIDATPCISRLDLTSDIEKVTNKVTVYGRKLYHLSLRYLGGDTPANGSKVNLLQHGWNKGQGDLAVYSQNTNPKYESGSSDLAKKPRWEIDEVTISKLGKTEEWRRKYTTIGVDYEANRHVFRLFVWNEAGEWRGNGTDAQKPRYYSTSNTNGASFDWVNPSVKAVWGGTPEHVRRRRPLRDGKWRDNTVDSFRRIQPMVFMAIMGADGVTLGPWFKMPTGKYKFDEERAAIWITAEDLAVWTPFDSLQNDDLNLPNDGRTFATLLLQGVLRLAIEGCVEGDDFKLAAPAIPADSGSPFYREVAFGGSAEFIKIADYNAGDGFVLTTPTANLVDDTADATTVANAILDAGKDAQVHSSIAVEPDWPRQSVGKTIATIAGRGIPMMAGQSALSGRPAQIVAYRMDCEAMKWELMTESAALALKAELKRANAEQRGRNVERDREARNGIRPRQADLNKPPPTP